MPVFEFHCEESGKTISVLVPITAPDEQRHFQIGDDGLTYRRVYSAPCAAVNSKMRDATKEDFRRMTEAKKLTNGDLWELSAEMSKEREEKGGVDPVKQRFYRNYEKEFGVKHTEEVKDEKRKRLKETAGKMGIKIDV